jgi:hypothetical protein
MSVRNLWLVAVVFYVACLSLAASADDAAARKALQAEYTKMAAAWKQGNLKGFMRVYAPDFKRTLPDGKTRSRAEEEAAYRTLLADTPRPDKVSLKILQANIHKNQVVIRVDVWWSRQGMYLKHLVDTDTWVKTSQGWKLKASSTPGGDKFSFTHRHDNSPTGRKSQ